MTDDNPGRLDPRVLGQLPAGITLKHPQPHWPPELHMALDTARASGNRWMIAVWRADDVQPDMLHLHLSRGSQWKYDWLLRAHAMLRDMLLAMPLESTPPPAEASSSHAS